jgi:nucleoside 2-deoxyribosyltransferase
MSQMTASEDHEDWTTVFLGVPTPGDSVTAREASELAVDAVRRACQHAGRDHDEPWHIEVTEGRLAPTDDPAAIRRAIRRKLVRDVDAVVVLLRDASFGCGREVGWAIAFGIPTLLLCRDSSTASPHAGGTPPEAPVEVREYGSPSELYDTVLGWMMERKAAIVAGPLRRSRPLAVTEPLRLAALSSWQEASAAERRRIRDALLVGEEQLEALLANDLDFAETRCGLALDLLAQLGIVVPERMSGDDWYRRSEVPSLPEDARLALKDAVETWNWDGPATLRAVELGLRKLRRDRELFEAGVRQRSSSLGNRFAWKRLVDGDASAGRPTG